MPLKAGPLTSHRRVSLPGSSDFPSSARVIPSLKLAHPASSHVAASRATCALGCHRSMPSPPRACRPRQAQVRRGRVAKPVVLRRSSDVCAWLTRQLGSEDWASLASGLRSPARRRGERSRSTTRICRASRSGSDWPRCWFWALLGRSCSCATAAGRCLDSRSRSPSCSPGGSRSSRPTSATGRPRSRCSPMPPGTAISSRCTTSAISTTGPSRTSSRATTTAPSICASWMRSI